MMRFFILIFLICFSCYSPNRDCTSFATGTFKSEVTIQGELFTSVFKRTKDIQIETYKNKVDSASIRWINDCEMVYTTIHPKNRIQKKAVHVKILTTTDSSYTYEYSYVGEKKKQKGVAYIMD